MSEQLQHVIVYGIVALTVGWFAWRLWGASRTRQKGGCGGDCGCKTAKQAPVDPDARVESWQKQLR
ncbi:MAG: FeoB-associated Cys-rich membrane protein [Opitutales bacterium]